ncbi:unnamed protein product [Adineta steineri]|uniref:Uncharacterized protein n=1 Tax=Adineta steineri TaxID=433720 RepID=A0A819T945_9BILA|nr:unnamed protein product [Adineta steineri]CAF4073052.1 unnamed protein product [Adineta steineri]
MGCLTRVTNFANQAIQGAADTFVEFKGAMRDVLPKLSEKEQHECFGTFRTYHELLMTTQRFVTRTLIRVRRAHQTNELLQSIDLESITRLCGQIRGLLNRFRHIESIIDTKVKEERTVKSMRNVFLGFFALAGAVCLIATGVGVGIGFTVGVKGTIAIAGCVSLVGGAGAAIAQTVQKLSTFELVMKNLSDTEELLTNISQNYAKIEAMGDLLQEDDTSKKDFITLLENVQEQVDKGFSLLAKM